MRWVDWQSICTVIIRCELKENWKAIKIMLSQGSVSFENKKTHGKGTDNTVQEEFCSLLILSHAITLLNYEMGRHGSISMRQLFSTYVCLLSRLDELPGGPLSGMVWWILFLLNGFFQESLVCSVFTANVFHLFCRASLFSPLTPSSFHLDWSLREFSNFSQKRKREGLV